MKKLLKKVIPQKIVDRIKGRKTYKGYRISTSLSDNQVYNDVCIEASLDMTAFANFRQNPAYKEILEHISEKDGQLYLDEINKNYPELIKDLAEFKKNDEWGNPDLFDYPGVSKISTSTLRYIKVLGDLKTLFISLENFNICEIGVGYGGQCRIINALYGAATYTLVDIKPALMLTQRYLDNYILKSVVSYKTMNELEIREYDLVISNYAFTELPRSIQDVYLYKTILNSKKGYITYNEINPEHFQSYKKAELLKLIPNSYAVDEVPLSGENNCIIIWGSNS
jgi:putative sugar O-methyltransferase